MAREEWLNIFIFGLEKLDMKNFFEKIKNE